MQELQVSADACLTGLWEQFPATEGYWASPALMSEHSWVDQGTALKADRAWPFLLIRAPSSVAWQKRVVSSASLECCRTGEVARHQGGGG